MKLILKNTSLVFSSKSKVNCIDNAYVDTTGNIVESSTYNSVASERIDISALDDADSLVWTYADNSTMGSAVTKRVGNIALYDADDNFIANNYWGMEDTMIAKTIANPKRKGAKYVRATFVKGSYGLSVKTSSGETLFEPIWSD